MSRWILLCICVIGCFIHPASARAGDKDAIGRGKKALENRAFTPSSWTADAYENAWQHWQPKLDKAPANYDQAFRNQYGLHAAPVANGRYPMGLRPGADGKGLAFDCLACHGGSILGKSVVGLGNQALDLQALFEDMNAASGRAGKLPFAVANVRGTNEAFGMTVALLALRNPDLSLREKPQQLELYDDMCEDVPAWWHLRKKKTIYHTGSTNSRSVRTLMQFMLNPANPLAAFEKEEAVFGDIQAYLLSLTSPKYPFPIAEKVAVQGRDLFGNRCAKCHGTYGSNGKYPNKIVAHDIIATDAKRLRGLSPKVVGFYNETWFAQEKPAGFKASDAEGYQAPPLDGVWATAPYLHNGSVPTLYDVLNSKTRPKLFTRSFATDEAAYDKTKVGWKVKILTERPEKTLPAIERRKVYATTQPGRGNGGHTFGDDLNENERWAIIEYLKTL